MKSLVVLLEYLLRDCGRKCNAPVSRDVKTLRARTEYEGDSFVTITLSSFCADFERSLDEGKIGPGRFLHFKKGPSGMPAFLSGFLSKVFGKDLVLLPCPSVDCIRAVRQICLFCKKVERPCTTARESAAIEGYANCDATSVVDAIPDSQLGRYFGYVANVLMRSLDLENVTLGDLRPKHGPGGTQERISGNQKFVHRVWHERLASEGFTFLRFAHSSEIVQKDELVDWPVSIEPGDEQPVRVVLVPKTLRTPRIIAVEPVCMQYAQQALSRHLVACLEMDRLTAGHVNFRDQTVNQMHSLHSSNSGRYATLDMKEASDLVSMAHFRALFAGAPEFRGFLEAARSLRAELPTGEVIQLSKFASMGSALCFPVESLVFFTSIVASRIRRAGLFPTTSTVYSYGRDVYVYGDDLIVPADEALAICDDLEALGFKVNRRKSFWTGKFRESCGSDCYGGEHVTPVYMRRDTPTSRGDVAGILSTVATANQLFSAGLTVTAYALRESVERLLGDLPVVPVESPAIGWWECSNTPPVRRWNTNLQREEIRVWTTTPSKKDDPLEGCPALTKCLLHVGNPDVPEDHLTSSPRPYSLALKRRWVSAN